MSESDDKQKFPEMDVKEPDSEKVIRGPKEGFTDSIKTNTALIEKRLRSERLKVQELKAGVRSQTAVDLIYMDDLAYPSVIKEMEMRLKNYEIDGVMDSGIIEQLGEEK